MSNTRIEQVPVAYLEFLPKKLSFPVSYNNGVTIINCDLNSCMFNIAHGFTNLVHDWQQEIRKCIALFKSKPFSWFIPPTVIHSGLSTFLFNSVFIIEKIEIPMMSCHLSCVILHSSQNILVIKQVQDFATLQDFIVVLEHLDSIVRFFYQKVHLEFLQQSEKLFIGYRNDKPVVTGILFEYDNEISGIFRLFTLEEERGKGFGTEMMTYLLQFAKNRGNRFVTLLASNLGYAIYNDLGFKEYGKFQYLECRAH